MNKKWLIIGTIAVVVIVVGMYSYLNSNNEDQVTEQVKTVEETPINDLVTTEESEANLVYKAFSDLNGVNQGLDSTGTVDVRYYDDGRYELLGKFQNLPPLPDGYFFEGWIVKQSPLEFDSTGKTTVSADGVVINEYTADIDYQTNGFNFYALTIEPDDGDPAPAEHVLDGTLRIIK